MSAPGLPTDIKTAMKSTSAIISWKRPSSIGSGLTGYRVIATSSNGGASQTLNVGATTVQAEITNLTRSKNIVLQLQHWAQQIVRLHFQVKQKYRML